MDNPADKLVLGEYVVAGEPPLVFVGAHDTHVMPPGLEVIYQVVGCEGGAVVGFPEDLTNNCNLHQVQF